MIDTKELRRLAQAALTGPDGVSLNWLKFLQDFQKEANPAAVSEPLNRLEAAEADALEQARLNGMGASREASLLAKLKAAEKERDHANAAAAGIALQAETLQAERDELRTELAQLHKEADKFGDGIDWIQRALQAESKIDSLIGFHVDEATDPAVNGGYKLVSVRLMPKTKGVGE